MQMNIVKNCIENCNAKSICLFDEAIIAPAVLIAKYVIVGICLKWQILKSYYVYYDTLCEFQEHFKISHNRDRNMVSYEAC